MKRSILCVPALVLALGAPGPATAAIRVLVRADAPSPRALDYDILGVSYKPQSGPTLKALHAPFTRFGAGVVDNFGPVHSFFTSPPTGTQTAATVPMDPRGVAFYDGHVQAMFSSGAEPILTLGEPSWISAGFTDGIHPPTNILDFQTLVERTIEHFTVDRVAAGKRPILYWDAWNEPDNKIYWAGNTGQWLRRAFLPIARAVRAVARRSHLPLRLGACSCVRPSSAFIPAVLSFAHKRHIRLDFISFHEYGNYPDLGPDGPEIGYSNPSPSRAKRNPDATPTRLGAQVDLVRALARYYLGYVPKLANIEWGLSAGGLDRRQDTADGAAFDAATLVEYVRHRLDFAVLQKSRDTFPSPSGTDLFGDLGLVSKQGVRKPAWYVFKLFGQLQPRLIPATMTGANALPGGMWQLASASPDRRRITTLLASWKALGAPRRSAGLWYSGLVLGVWRADVYRIDGSHPTATAPVTTRTLTVRSSATTRPLQLPLPGPTVLVVSLRRLHGLPKPKPKPKKAKPKHHAARA